MRISAPAAHLRKYTVAAYQYEAQHDGAQCAALRSVGQETRRGVSGGGIVGKPCCALLPPKRATEAQDSTATMRLLSPHHRARARQGAGTFLGARKEINHLGETAKLGLGSDCIPASATLRKANGRRPSMTAAAAAATRRPSAKGAPETRSRRGIRRLFSSGNP
ncbi:hypothetical protein VFPBJ_00174 [Purpureocillium lilacinum]|uniref:Uncharacterized protein n=1 Tax=Purpureocillium lilacinum TaxID=33203 RepID=A0A179H7K4_PURLI|nr:hypothetical protein VFPBJ_00174 [Purpureocillium lilacinum]